MRSLLADTVASPRVITGTGKEAGRLARAAKITGGTLSFSALALGSTQLYSISTFTLGPGAFMFSIPKLIGGPFAPFLAVAGALGAAFGVSALWLERGKVPKVAGRSGLAGIRALGLGAPLIVLAGLTSVAANAIYTRDVLAARGDFAAAFGTDWEERIPEHLRSGMLSQRWTWMLPVPSGAHVERDVVFATVPATDRNLLADVWSPPEGVSRSGLGFIYLHGGGYTAFDKGGPTEPWFRHLASQGHVVMDVSYRLIPETNIPGMQGDVKRALAWMKRNAERYRVDPNKIVLGGGSGGSHLALLAAYAPYHPSFTPEDVRGIDLSVRGVVGYYNAGDVRLESWPKDERSPFVRSVVKSVASLLTSLWGALTGAEIAVDETGNWDPKLFFGGQPEQWPELYRAASPITHVGSSTPPTLQIVGEHDAYGGMRSVPALHERLREAGVPSVEIRIPRTEHAFDLPFPTLSPAAQTAMYDVDRFLALMAAPVDWKASSSAVGPR